MKTAHLLARIKREGGALGQIVFRPVWPDIQPQIPIFLMHTQTQLKSAQIKGRLLLDRTALPPRVSRIRRIQTDWT